MDFLDEVVDLVAGDDEDGDNRNRGGHNRGRHGGSGHKYHHGSSSNHHHGSSHNYPGGHPGASNYYPNASNFNHPASNYHPSASKYHPDASNYHSSSNDYNQSRYSGGHPGTNSYGHPSAPPANNHGSNHSSYASNHNSNQPDIFGAIFGGGSSGYGNTNHGNNDQYYNNNKPSSNHDSPPSYDSYMGAHKRYDNNSPNRHGNSGPNIVPYRGDQYPAVKPVDAMPYNNNSNSGAPVLETNHNYGNDSKNHPPAIFAHPTIPHIRRPRKDVGAVVRMLSGCRDDEKSADVHNVATMGLPTNRGSGGACTHALLSSTQEGRTSWVGLLKRMQRFLKEQRLPQVPQLSTNRQLDLHVPFEIMQPNSTRHRAVLIGINYVGQRGELRGCHNDVAAMKAYLVSEGYTDTPGTMCILCDDGVHAPPIAANIKSAFSWLVEGATAGYSLFLHYSGHGGSIPDDNGDEEDGMDETIIPVDHERVGHIRDDDIYKILVEPLQDGVELTIVMDCCHSGTIIDLPYTLNCTGDLIAAMDAGEFTTLDSSFSRNTHPKRIKDPRQGAGYYQNSPQSHTNPSFNPPASNPYATPSFNNPTASNPYATPSFNPPASNPYATPSFDPPAASPYATPSFNPSGGNQDSEYARKAAESVRADVYMISGCEDSQTSADVRDVATFGLPDSRGAGGACTNAFLKSLKYGSTTWIGLLKQMHQILREKRFKQTPQLSTSSMMDLSKPFYVMHPRSRRHRAVLIGINYVGQKGELRGCHNDVSTMKAYLLSQGYSDSPETMCILCDDGRHAPPVAANIKSAFNWLVDGAEAGDSLFFHYSGHGGRVKDLDGDEADGMDETIIPLDYKQAGQIIDDDIFKMIVAPLKPGVHFTILMDCCHSGTIIDLPYVLNCTGELVKAMEAGKVPSMMPNTNFSFSRMLKLGKDLYRMKKEKASVIQMGQHAAHSLGVSPQILSGMANKMGFKM